MPLCKIHEEKTVNGIFYEGKWKLGTLNCRREHFVKAKGLIILVSSCLAAFELYRKFRDVCNCSSTIPYSHRCKLPRVKMQRIVLVTKSTGDCIDICDKLSQCRSINFNWVHFLCELNKVDVHIAPQSLITSKGFVYLDNPWIKFQLVSCGKVFVESSETQHFSLNRKIGAL